MLDGKYTQPSLSPLYRKVLKMLFNPILPIVERPHS